MLVEVRGAFAAAHRELTTREPNHLRAGCTGLQFIGEFFTANDGNRVFNRSRFVACGNHFGLLLSRIVWRRLIDDSFRFDLNLNIYQVIA